MQDRAIIGTVVLNRTGKLQGRVSKMTGEMTSRGSTRCLIEWEDGTTSSAWDTDLTNPVNKKFCKLGGWYINDSGVLQVCEQ